MACRQRPVTPGTGSSPSSSRWEKWGILPPGGECPRQPSLQEHPISSSLSACWCWHFPSALFAPVFLVAEYIQLEKGCQCDFLIKGVFYQEGF